MKTVGIIGGIGPESTVEYYRLLIASYRERKGDGSQPSIILNSVDLKKMLGLMEVNDLASATEYLLVEIQKLQRAGADFGVLASNTPHIVFDELSRRSTLPLLSIVEATGDAAAVLGLQRLGLFGTRYTMQARFYPDVLSRRSMTLVLPDADEQDYIHDKYINELLKNIFLPETRAGLLRIAYRLKEQEGIEGLILGGTELPLILTPDAIPELPLLDTTRVHVEAVVARLLST